MKCIIILLATITFFSVDILSQSIPKQINYQGLLKDAAGNNVSDGTYSMVFSIYNEPTGGTALWSETQDVAVSGGLFFVRLGSVTPITTVPFDRQHYLGITVNSGDELTPRTYLSPSPYSFMSMNVVDNSITTSKIQDGAVTKTKLGSDVSLGTSGAAGGDLKGNYPNPIVQKLQGKSISETAPSVDQVLKWDGTEWKPSADATTTGTAGGDITKVTAGNGLTGGGDANDVTLNVGAGNGITVSADAVALNTTYSDSRYVNEGQANSVTANMITPNIVSSVDGVSNDGGNIDLVAGSNITITPNNTAKTITISGAGTAGDNLGNHTATQNIKLNNHWLSGDGGNEGVYVSSTGNVGIGTATPDYALHIKGWIKEEGSDFYMVDPSRGNGGRALVHWGTNNNDDELILNTDGDFEKGVLVMGSGLTVDSALIVAGNIGIGTYSPSTKLDLVGDMKISGSNGNLQFVDRSSTSSQYNIFASGLSLNFAYGGQTNFRFAGANTYLGEGFASLGPRLTVGTNGDGSYARANSWQLFSDERFKNNISSLENAISTIKKIRGVAFRWKKSDLPDIGFIAQEIEQVLPNIVGTDEETGYKSVDYSRITPILVEAVKEQQKIIEELTRRIENLENK